jgi:hypothetical protein
MDVLEEVGEWRLYLDGEEYEFESEKDFKAWLEESCKSLGTSKVMFSGNKEKI